MNTSQPHANDPDVITSTTGLIAFLREVVQNSTQRLRDDRDRSKFDRLWLTQLPEGLSRPSAKVDGTLLTLDHVPQSAPPDLPGLLVGWVEPEATQNPEAGDPPLAEEGPDETGSPTRREDAAEVLRVFGSWLQRWRGWAERERVNRPVRELYERIYRWHQRLAQQDDEQELVLAVGLLTWEETNGSAVHRHIVTQRLQITMERRTARLTVRLASESPLRMEDRNFLDSDDGWRPEQSAAIREDLDTRSPHPLSELVREQLDQWQDRALSRPISFSVAWEPPLEPEPGARLTFAPALIMRPRDRNKLLECYEGISASIATEAHAPLGLAQLVLPLTDEARTGWDRRGLPALLSDHPLFPMKTNAQQRDVLRRLERSTAVVVQGPPGTGKTHTIANLVCALVAQGQRVLVTSARDQPLSVLRDKLPEQVRNLCVLLLSSSHRGGVDEMERTVNALTDSVASTDQHQLKDEIRDLSVQRDEVRARITTLTDEIVALREAEIRHHSGVAARYEGTLTQLVQQVKDGESRFGWIGTVPAEASVSPPLSSVEAEELLVLLRSGAGRPHPGGVPRSPDELPTPEEVAAVLAASRMTDDGLSQDALSLRDALAALDITVTDQLAALLDECRDALHRLGMPAGAEHWGSDSWFSRALQDRLAGRQEPLWRRVAAAVNDVGAVRREVEAVGLKEVTLPENARTRAFSGGER